MTANPNANPEMIPSGRNVMSIPYHWLGADAERVWRKYLEKCEADAEAQRKLAEAIDE